MQIIWSDEAIADYHVIELIKSRPELYPLTDYKGIRKAVIRKQITLFFNVSDKALHLIRFWNNYQNPEQLKL